MTGFPPAGVYVIISSDAVTVTNQPIDVGTAEEGGGGTESGGGSDEGTESGGGSDEGTESGGGSDEGTNQARESRIKFSSDIQHGF